LSQRVAQRGTENDEFCESTIKTASRVFFTVTVVIVLTSTFTYIDRENLTFYRGWICSNQVRPGSFGISLSNLYPDLNKSVSQPFYVPWLQGEHDGEINRSASESIMNAARGGLGRLSSLKRLPCVASQLPPFRSHDAYIHITRSHGASPFRTLRTTTPAQGLLDTMRGAYDEATKGSQAKKEQLVFEAQQKFLIDESRKINGDVYLELMREMKAASGLSGVKEHMPWVQNNPALGEFKSQERIVHAMTPAQRKDIFSIGIAAKKRIASHAEVNLQDVESMLGHISLLIRLQKWIVGRKRQGLLLPRNSVELQAMMTDPSSGMKRGSQGQGPRPPNPGVRMKGQRRMMSAMCGSQLASAELTTE